MPATATVAGGVTVRRRGGLPRRRDRFSGLAAGRQRSVIRALRVKESRIPLRCIQATLAAAHLRSGRFPWLRDVHKTVGRSDQRRVAASPRRPYPREYPLPPETGMAHHEQLPLLFVVNTNPEAGAVTVCDAGQTTPPLKVTVTTTVAPSVTLKLKVRGLLLPEPSSVPQLVGDPPLTVY